MDDAKIATIRGEQGDGRPMADEAGQTWIVCHRQFDHGCAGLYAFSAEQRAYLHVARLICEDVQALLELDPENGAKIVQALREGRYETALELYHCIDGNLDTIDVALVETDQFHSDEPLEIPAG